LKWRHLNHIGRTFIQPSGHGISAWAAQPGQIRLERKRVVIIETPSSGTTSRTWVQPYAPGLPSPHAGQLPPHRFPVITALIFLPRGIDCLPAFRPEIKIFRAGRPGLPEPEGMIEATGLPASAFAWPVLTAATPTPTRPFQTLPGTNHLMSILAQRGLEIEARGF
jgi:hypothetical protein